MDERHGYPSCSSLGRIMACSASYLREEQAARLLPERPNASAAEGTAVHAALAGAVEPTTLSLFGQYIYDRCCDLEQGLVAQLGFDNEDVEILSESRLWWKPVDANEIVNLSGKTDKRYIDRRRHRALIIDYKAGRVEVDDASDNWQLAGYAWLEWFADAAMPSELQEIYVAIIQPMNDKPVTIAEYRASDMGLLKKRIETQLLIAQDAEAKATAGEHCDWCKARGSCEDALRYVTDSLIPVEKVVEQKTGRKTEFIVPRLTPAQIVEYLPKKRVLTAIMKAIDEQAKAYALANELPGYSLTDGKAHFVFTDVIRAWEILREAFEPPQIAACVSVRLESLDELAESAGNTKSEAREWWKARLDGCYEIGRTAPELKKAKG